MKEPGSRLLVSDAHTLETREGDLRAPGRLVVGLDVEQPVEELFARERAPRGEARQHLVDRPAERDEQVDLVDEGRDVLRREPSPGPVEEGFVVAGSVDEILAHGAGPRAGLREAAAVFTSSATVRLRDVVGRARPSVPQEEDDRWQRQESAENREQRCSSPCHRSSDLRCVAGVGVRSGSAAWVGAATTEQESRKDQEREPAEAGHALTGREVRVEVGVREANLVEAREGFEPGDGARDAPMDFAAVPSEGGDRRVRAARAGRAVRARGAVRPAAAGAGGAAGALGVGGAARAGRAVRAVRAARARGAVGAARAGAGVVRAVGAVGAGAVLRAARPLGAVRGPGAAVGLGADPGVRAALGVGALGSDRAPVTVRAAVPAGAGAPPQRRAAGQLRLQAALRGLEGQQLAEEPGRRDVRDVGHLDLSRLPEVCQRLKRGPAG